MKKISGQDLCDFFRGFVYYGGKKLKMEYEVRKKAEVKDSLQLMQRLNLSKKKEISIIN